MKKVLIISMNAVGDTFLSLSAIEPLKKEFGEIELDFAASPSSVFLMPFAKPKLLYSMPKKAFVLLLLITTIRRKEYDYVFNFFPGRINTLLTFTAKAKVKAGYFNLRTLNDWYKKSQAVKVKGLKAAAAKWKPGMTYTERIKLVLNAAGIKAESIVKFKDDSIINNNREDYILIHPFSRESARAIPADMLKNLIGQLKEEFNKKIIVTGSAEEINGGYISMLEKLNIETVFEKNIGGFVNLICNSSCFIGTDSFPLHIADAYNIKFIGIFGVTNPSSVLQNKDNHVRIDKKEISRQDPEKLITAIINKARCLIYTA